MTITAVAPPQTHRERKKLATRRAIHDAAFELVDRNGLSGTTIEAISERAGVAPRTFWSYFGSKEDAVIDRDPEWPAILRAELRNRPADEDSVTALRCVLERYVADRVVDSERAVRRLELVRREPHLMATAAAVFDEIEQALTLAIAERLNLDPDTDLRPAVLVMAACGATRVAQHRWAAQKGRQPFDELLADAFEELAEGLTPLVQSHRSSRRVVQGAAGDHH